jgi:acetylornithine deacetylase/succinyl-diaminopimelate desuccinylase-like protein
VRYHGKGGPNAPKPLLLLAHIDVVEALKSDWSPDLDPFKFIERDGYFTRAARPTINQWPRSSSPT